MGFSVVGPGSAYFNKMAAMEAEDDMKYMDIKDKSHFAIEANEATEAYETPMGGSGGSSPGVVSAYSDATSTFRLPVYDNAHIPPPEYTRHPSVDENKY